MTASCFPCVRQTCSGDRGRFSIEATSRQQQPRSAEVVLGDLRAAVGSTRSAAIPPKAGLPPARVMGSRLCSRDAASDRSERPAAWDVAAAWSETARSRRMFSSTITGRDEGSALARPRDGAESKPAG